jgi:alginate O-acetyltransferase complex protein AlgI
VLFNSYAFIFVFFPLTFACFFLIARRSRPAAAAWLTAASLFFYGWWSVRAVPLLVASIIFNYLAGRRLAGLAAAGSTSAGNATAGNTTAGNTTAGKRVLVVALVVNLGLLAFFKYANFFIANANFALGALHQPTVAAVNILLPIGISFFTFTQIAFLVDCWEGKVKESSSIHYALFVTYFPHLIAGPVLHHGQMMPQFARADTYRPHADHITMGFTLFAIGMAKKLLIADPLAAYADLLFRGVADGVVPQLLLSWFGVLAYTFQIYFDFSGYSDMAIGLSLMLGITLPINFNSPYRATSIIDFWRRWHISLSVFLRDYLYIPLGGNRYGALRRHANLLTTMVLGGLWHGASWTFVLWGAAHGMLLVINHGWRALCGEREYGIPGRVLSWAITFLSVCFAWVLFRADSLDSATIIYRGMLGLNGVTLPGSLSALGTWTDRLGVRFDDVWQRLPLAGLSTSDFMLLTGVAAAVAFLLPNTNRLRPGADAPRAGYWRSYAAGACCAALFMLSLSVITKPSPFLYFQF